MQTKDEIVGNKSSNSNEPIIIDLWTRYKDASLFARDLWQALFRHTEAYKWRSLDNFLIDLKYFQDYIEKGEFFYWGFIGDSGHTKIHPYKDFHPVYMDAYLDNIYLIQLVSNTQKGELFLKITKQEFDW